MFSWCGALLNPFLLQTTLMAGLEDLWARFTLTEDEERGADVLNQEDVEVHQLVGRFFYEKSAKCRCNGSHLQATVETGK